MTVPVFISYHGTDVEIARALRTSLLRLSGAFDVFLDRDSIAQGANYEQLIRDKIRDAEWFVIVCTGLPRRSDMEWSYFEAGQFRATLKDTLAAEADKRMVCIFDDEPPSILSKFQGVQVSTKQRGGKTIDMLLRAGENIQLDDSAIFNLLEQMIRNAPGQPLRDLTAASTREMLREESHKLITLFLAAGGGTLVKETSLQPRISFELPAGASLSPQTVVRGYEGSLNLLFGILSKSEEIEETTWADVIKSCCTANGGKPAWLSDIEVAAAEIMEDRAPPNSANKCLLENVIYRVITARYQVYKDHRRVIYIVFLPESRQPFDLTRRSSTLLSSMILSIRFREQLIPMAKPLGAQPSAEMLQNFYRLLLAIEMEALQFGLVIESKIPDEESPLAAAFTNNRDRNIIRDRINEWVPDRSMIEKIFVDEPLDLKVPGDVAKGAAVIAGILEKIAHVNASFIEMIAEELLAQIKAGDKDRPKGRPKKVKARPPKKPAKKAAGKR
jgi:TIR domain